MKRLFHQFLPTLFLFLLFGLSSFLFLRHLGQTPLRSWDEAWYAEIARNILKTGNWFLLQWNGLPYFDHPPLGFWLMAVSFKILGVSELSSRLLSAICGIGSVILIYRLGEKLFNRLIGFWAGIILATIPWFWLRAREGNLDILLTFFMLLTIWIALKIKANQKLFPFLGISFGLALLTKTVIALGLLPALIYIIFKEKFKFSKIYLLITVCCLLFTVLPWYLINYQAYNLTFLDRNIFVTGLKLPGYKAFFSAKTIGQTFSLINTLSQVQNGISLWNKPFLVAFLFSSFFILFFKQKSLLTLYLWLVPYLAIFSLSAKIELWHLIILYPAIALIISAFIAKSAEILIEKISIQFVRKINLKILLNHLAFLFISTFIFWNSYRIIKGLYKDIIKNQPLNDEVVLVKATGENEDIIYIDDDYWPAAVFYSKKKVFSLPHSTDTPIKTVGQLFKEEKNPFLLLTKKWILEKDKINPKNFTILKQVGERILVRGNTK